MNDVLPGKEPLLLPTPSLTPDEFEDFTERLLHAHRFCAEPLRRVVRAERWGRKGDKQDGIDFEGTWSDGTTAAWQCKRYDSLPPAKVKDFIEECTFKADEYYLTFSGEASRDARAKAAEYENWQILDRRGLGRMVDDLPLHKRRQVLDATWGVQTRKLLLEVPGEDAFLSLATFASDRRDPANLLNDCAELVGREVEVSLLAGALDRAADWPPIVLVTGPGGRGKTRLVLEALTATENQSPHIPVICLADGRKIDAEALRELPLAPATIFVDDAHREPEAIAPLLDYLRRTSGTQLILSSRGTGRDQLRAQIVTSNFRLNQVHEVQVGELTLAQGRKLVSSLSAGLEFSSALSEHLAQQAMDGPHIAVLAASLIRRGELVGPLALDHGLREQVLLRYQEVLAGEIDNFDGETVRRVLAVHAAIGPVEADEKVLTRRIADFCDLKFAEYLRLLERLHYRGLLVTRTGHTRVSPDVLADQILERQSVILGQDSGFTREVWDTFGDSFRYKLVVTLSELDWRLTAHGGVSIIGHIWTSLRNELSSLSLAALRDAVKGLEPLTYTQPKALLELLEQVRERLQNHGSAQLTKGAEALIVVADGESALREALNLPPITVTDINELLPRLFGLCAVNAPELLEAALDALWILRRDDQREPHQYPDHAERVIADHLGDLGDLPDNTFPARITARVERWLDERTDSEDLRTPLFALKSLLMKEGQHYVAKNRREISIQPFLVSPVWARTVRDEIRRVLLQQASGSDLPSAGEAVDLLCVALEEPRGMGGAIAGPNASLAWESDDLATLAVLDQAAGTTTSPVVRRLIRHQIEWSAQYSHSTMVRHAALRLVSKLDERSDDLAETLLDDHGLMSSRRGLQVPTLQELEVAMDSEPATSEGVDEGAEYAELLKRAETEIARRDSERSQRLAEVVQSLPVDEDLDAVLNILDDCLSQIRLAQRRQDSGSGLGALFETLATHSPASIPGLVQKASSHADGPLDYQFHLLIRAWAHQDETSLLAWLGQLPKLRKGMRLAVGTAFDLYGWADRERFSEVYSLGTGDSEPDVRNRFLRAGHSLLATQTGATAELLLKAGASSSTVIYALKRAARYSGYEWGQGLQEADAVAALRLIDQTEWRSRTIRQIAAGIAARFPRLVLDHLLNRHATSRSLPTEIEGLADAFTNHSPELVEWMVERAQMQDRRSARLVCALAMSSGITEGQSAALVSAFDSLDGPKLFGIVDLLTGVSIWPLKQPELARQLLERAGSGTADDPEAMLRRLKDAMRVRHWSFSNGVSQELERAQAAAARAAETETNSMLRAAYVEVAEGIQYDISETRRRYEDDDD